MDETYSSLERIRKKRDFLSLYKNGRRFKGKNIILIYLYSNRVYSRMSVVVSKKHGNAVRRNKIKRQIRTLFRRNKILLARSIDFLIIPKREFHNASWASLEEDYQRAVDTIAGSSNTE